MRFLLPASVLLLFPMGVGAAEPIKAEQFAKLHALIKPQVDEDQYLQIPWQTNIWEARIKAAAEGKPILLWEMDGNPLGCT